MGQELIRSRFINEEELKDKCYGQQFLCLDEETNEPRTMKIVPLQGKLAPTDIDIQKMKLECKKYLDLQHQHLLKVISIFEAERVYYRGTPDRIQCNALYVVYERPTNLKLSKYLGLLSYNQIIQLYNHIGSALAYLHLQGVTHRDVNIDNIYVNPKKTYFWLTNIEIPTVNPVNQPSYKKYYISPDTFERKYFTNRGDFWALGIVLLEVVLGKPLFHQKSNKFPAFDLGFPSEQILQRVENQEIRLKIKSLLSRDTKDYQFEQIKFKLTESEIDWIQQNQDILRLRKVLKIPRNNLQFSQKLELIDEDELELLDITNTNFTDLKYLIYPHFPRLRRLWLNDNLIENLTYLNLWAFPQLQQIKLDHNHIKTMDALEALDLRELKWLYLDSNKISSINAIIKFKFPNLRLLWLAHNQIQNLSVLLKMPFKQLEQFSLEYNWISQKHLLKYQAQIQERFQTCKFWLGCSHLFDEALP